MAEFRVSRASRHERALEEGLAARGSDILEMAACLGPAPWMPLIGAPLNDWAGAIKIRRTRVSASHRPRTLLCGINAVHRRQLNMPTSSTTPPAIKDMTLLTVKNVGFRP